MEKMAVRLLLLLAVINFAVAQETPTYVKTGAKLTLDLSPRPAEKITNILWKFNGDLLAEWVENVVLLGYYDPFKGRTVLDINTGRLVIDKTTEADQGVYTVEVNNKVQSVSYKAMAIEDPNKPIVHPQPLTCSPDSHESCTMSCETNTTRTGPLIYSWKKDDGEWMEAEQKLPITKTEDSGVKTFTCRVKNPLGVLVDSEPVNNRLFKKEESGGSGNGMTVVIIVVVLILIVLVVLLLLFLAWKRNMLPCKGAGNYDTHAPVPIEEVGKPDLPSNGDSTVQPAPGKDGPDYENIALNQPQGEPAAEEPAAEKPAAEEPAANAPTKEV